MTAKQQPQQQRQPPPLRWFLGKEPGYDILTAMDTTFAKWFEGPSWDTWRAILKAAFCLPMDGDEMALFKAVSGGRSAPKRRVRELWVIGGRRGGKDSVASLIAVYMAAFFQVGLDKLRPGERAQIQCLAVDRDQSKVVLEYIRSFFDHNKTLDNLVMRRTRDGLQLVNGCDIVVATNSFRAVRGRSVLVSIFDECAFWLNERSARPDTETYNAVLPSLATLPGSMLVGISTPHRKSGLLFTKFRKYFGVDDDSTLVIRAPTTTLNPTIDPEAIERAMEENPDKARAEWFAEFRDDISGFVDPEVVEACVMRHVRELPPASGVRYFAFCDPSGGSSDSMTAAVCHREGDKVIVDCIRERRAPFAPSDVCLEFAAMFRSYGCGVVQSDKYGGLWITESFAKVGIRVEQSARSKSELYTDLLPLLNSQRIALLDNPRLVSQLCSLERSTSRVGRDTIDHADGAHDDIVNSVAGAAALAIANQGVHVSPELLQKVLAMPPRRRDTAWGVERRIRTMAYLNQITPRGRKVGYPELMTSGEADDHDAQL